MILLSIFLCELFCTVHGAPGIDVKVVGDLPATKNSSLQLACLISDYPGGSTASLFKATSPTERPGTNIGTCVSGLCLKSEGSPRYTMRRNDTGMYLDISQLDRSEDQAWWRCTLDSTIPTVEGLVYLNVYTSPEAVHFSNPLPGPTDLGRESFSIHCKTSECSYPAPSTLAWYYMLDGKKQLFVGGSQVETSESSGCPENDESYYISTLTLPRLSTLPSNGTNAVTFVCGMNHTVTGWKYTPESPVVTFAEPPVINKENLNTKVLSEGDSSYTLYCPAKSNPPSMFTWYKVGVASPLKQGAGTQSDNSLSYTLINVTRSDAGRYRCTADNGVVPSDEVIVQVLVKYAPDVTYISPDGIFDVDSPVTLTCTVDTGPVGSPNVTWFRQGVMAPLQTDSVSTSELVIPTIQCDQMSNYICRATNDMGTDERTVEVLVKCPPTENPNTPHQRNVPVEIGSNTSLVIHIVSYRLPTFTWTVPAADKPQSQSQSVDQADQGRSSMLLIKNLHVLGEYVVTVSNGVLPDASFAFNVSKKEVNAVTSQAVCKGQEPVSTTAIIVPVCTGLVCLVLGAVVTVLLGKCHRRCRAACCEPMYADAKPREDEHTYSDVSPDQPGPALQMADVNVARMNREDTDNRDTYENL